MNWNLNSLRVRFFILFLLWILYRGKTTIYYYIVSSSGILSSLTTVIIEGVSRIHHPSDPRHILVWRNLWKSRRTSLTMLSRPLARTNVYSNNAPSFLFPTRKQLFSKITNSSDQKCQGIYQFLVQNPVIQSFVRTILLLSLMTSTLFTVSPF